MCEPLQILLRHALLCLTSGYPGPLLRFRKLRLRQDPLRTGQEALWRLPSDRIGVDKRLWSTERFVVTARVPRSFFEIR